MQEYAGFGYLAIFAGQNPRTPPAPRGARTGGTVCSRGRLGGRPGRDGLQPEPFWVGGRSGKRIRIGAGAAKG